jgi:hypothetical protein
MIRVTYFHGDLTLFGQFRVKELRLFGVLVYSATKEPL